MPNEADLSVLLCIFCYYSLFSQKHNQHLVNSIYNQWSFFFLFLLDYDLSTARIMYFFRGKKNNGILFISCSLDLACAWPTIHTVIIQCMSERNKIVASLTTSWILHSWMKHQEMVMHVTLVVIRHWDETAAIYHRDIVSTVFVKNTWTWNFYRYTTFFTPSLHSALIASFACSKSIHDFLFLFVSSLNSPV